MRASRAFMYTTAAVLLLMIAVGLAIRMYAAGGSHLLDKPVHRVMSRYNDVLPRFAMEWLVHCDHSRFPEFGDRMPAEVRYNGIRLSPEEVAKRVYLLPRPSGNRLPTPSGLVVRATRR